MTLDISDFIPVSLVETYKYIEVTYGNFITAKQTGEVQIKFHDINGIPFIAISYNKLPETDLCDGLFYIIKLMNFGQT